MRLAIAVFGRTLFELTVDHAPEPDDEVPFGFGGSTLYVERADEPGLLDEHTE